MSDEVLQNETVKASAENIISADTVLTASQIKLKERYVIDFSEPIQALDMNGAKAYKVNDIIDKNKLLFALVFNVESVPISDAFAAPMFVRTCAFCAVVKSCSLMVTTSVRSLSFRFSP